MKKLLIPIIFILIAQVTFGQIVGTPLPQKVHGYGGGGSGGISQTTLNDSTNSVRTDLGNAINLKLAIADTSAMLTPYATQYWSTANFYPLTNPSGFISNITGLVTAGTNMTRTGSGTSGDPYVFNSTGGSGTSTYVKQGFGTIVDSSSGNKYTITVDTAALAYKVNLHHPLYFNPVDTSLNVDTTGFSGGGSGISKVLPGFGQLAVNDSTNNVDTTVVTPIAKSVRDSTMFAASLSKKYDSTQFIIANTFQDVLATASTGFSNYNGATSSYDGTNKRLAVTTSGLSGGYGKGISFGTAVANHRYVVYINVTANTVKTNGGALRLFCNGLSQQITIDLNDGDNWITLTAWASGSFAINANQNGTFYVNAVKIQEVPASFNYATKGDVLPQVALYAPIVANTAALQYVKVASTIIVLGQYSSALAGGSFAIGNSATVAATETGSIAFGDHAKAFVDPTYGASGGGSLAFGQGSIAGSWRATAIGAYSQALPVSSTAIGYAAYVNIAHAVVIGRGGYMDKGGFLFSTIPSLVVNPDFYFGGAAGKTYNAVVPGGETVDMSTSLLAGTFVSNLRGLPGRDATASPSLTNIPGGRINIAGGQSTGTASGGDVTISYTPATGTSNNTVNPDSVAVRVSGTDGSVKFNHVATGAATDSVLTINGGIIKKTGHARAQATLVAGTKSITVTGVTSSSNALVSFVSVGGTITTTWQYAIVCTTNTVTITALTNTGSTDTSDTSTLTYDVTF